MVLLLQYGTWIEKKTNTPTLAQMYQIKKKSLGYRSSIGFGMANAVVIRHVQRSFLDPFLGRIYRRYRIAESNEMAYALMEQDQSPEEVTIEKYAVKKRLPVEKKIGSGWNNKAKLVYSSFNRLVFEIQCDEAAFFGLAYPYTRNWRAYVNDHRVRIYRANGAYLAVEVPAGISRLEFRYWSTAAFWGMVISWVTLLSIGLIACFGAAKRPLNIWIAVSICILVIAGFSYWWRSLYRGADLQTTYSWKEIPSSSMSNIAYGKRTFMSSLLFLD